MQTNCPTCACALPLLHLHAACNTAPTPRYHLRCHFPSLTPATCLTLPHAMPATGTLLPPLVWDTRLLPYHSTPCHPTSEHGCTPHLTTLVVLVVTTSARTSPLPVTRTAIADLRILLPPPPCLTHRASLRAHRSACRGIVLTRLHRSMVLAEQLRLEPSLRTGTYAHALTTASSRLLGSLQNPSATPLSRMASYCWISRGCQLQNTLAHTCLLDAAQTRHTPRLHTARFASHGTTTAKLSNFGLRDWQKRPALR